MAHITRREPKKVSFTVAALEAMTVPQGKDRHYIYDAKTPGLAYCLTAAGSRSFYLYRWIDGKPKRVRLGGDELSIEQARKAAARANGKIADGIDPQAEKHARRREATLGEVWKWYLENHAKPHKRSWGVDQRQWNDLFTEWTGHRLSAIKSTAVQAKHTAIASERGKIAANRALTLLRALFNTAKKHFDFSRSDPTERIKRFPENERERFLLPEEMPKFLEAVEASPTDLMRDYWKVLLFTGQRKSAVAAMAWDQLHLEAAVWMMPAELAKNKRPTVIPLVPEAVTILTKRLKDRVADCPWVFPGRGRDGHMTVMKFAWKKLLEKAGLKDIVIHDIRRTLGSWQANMGASLQIIGRSLGHSSDRSTKIYARLVLDPVRQSMAKATAAMHAATPKN